jgi:hypothetical protein
VYRTGRHYNSVLEITVSILGRHKWEPDIYIRFSPALHLQWRNFVTRGIVLRRERKLWACINFS